MQPARKNGFTLIEVMVALIIFVTIASSASGLLKLMLRTQAALNEKSQQLEDLQDILITTRQEIMQMTPHITNTAPYTLSPTTLTFLRLGWDNPLSEPRSNIVQMRYTFSGTSLMREFYAPVAPNAAATPDVAPALKFTLSDHIANVEFSDVPIASSSSGTSLIPQAVRLSIRMPGLDDVSTLIALVQQP